MAEQVIFAVGADGAVDERLGLVAVKLPFVVEPLADRIATLRKALTIYPGELQQVGLSLLKRDVKQRGDGGYDVDFSLDGHFDPATASGEEFSLDGTTSEDPIESNPNIRALIANYNGDRKEDGSVIFPISLTINGQTVGNPMHGVKSYLNPGLVWTRTKLFQQLPRDLVKALGTIDVPPSGPLQSPPELDGHRNWLKIRIKADWRGNIWKLAESWLISGPDGFTDEIYPRGRTVG